MSEKKTKRSSWTLIAAFMVLFPAGLALNVWGVLCFADWLDVPGVTPWRALVFVCLYAWLASSSGGSKSNDGAEKNPIVFTCVVLLLRTALLGFFALIVWAGEN